MAIATHTGRGLVSSSVVCGVLSPQNLGQSPHNFGKKCVKSEEKSGKSRILMVLWEVLTGSAPSTCFEKLRLCTPVMLRKCMSQQRCNGLISCIVMCWTAAIGVRAWNFDLFAIMEAGHFTCIVKIVSIKSINQYNLKLWADFKGIIRVSKLQGIDLFYYLLDLRELANSNDMHKSLVGALFWKK